ncbi:HAD family hydrolase [Halococcoides cellulosivorans]|uniref:Haloacid dehalogenase n=1 Tax=Halococcoides cellulosivorans TaxID=1679096 RepID=A0A2R4X0R4_9EURY|nr:HAD-IA family hydrolase [Halococcoides cellulosivorans]AWB27387.1 haloacid dehalogenase [Halococcoides cellulosivorans]
MAAVLFDMDGVVIDSEAAWQRHKRETILPAVVPDGSADPAEITGMYYREIYDYLDANYETAVDRERCDELFEAAGREIYGGDAGLMDGFPELVDALHDRGASVALVTSSPHDWIDLVLESFDLTEAFDTIASAADVERGKPEPDVYERAIDALGESPADCVAVEDSTNGSRAAVAAGAYTIGYTGVHDGVDRSVPDELVGDPATLRERLLALIE